MKDFIALMIIVFFLYCGYIAATYDGGIFNETVSDQ